MKQRMRTWVRRLEQKAELSRGRIPQPVTQQDLDDWFQVAHNPVLQELQRRNPFRWARLQSDVRWVRKEIEKMGYDPEEVRWWM